MSKRVHSINEKRATTNIRNQWEADPKLQCRISVSASQASGGVALSWYRGEQAGIHSAYLTIKDEFPEAAQSLPDAWGMDGEDGSL